MLVEGHCPAGCCQLPSCHSSHFARITTASFKVAGYPSPAVGRSVQAQPSGSVFGADAFMAAGGRPRSFDAAPGSPLSRRAATAHSRASSRSFDATPGSPLAQRSLPDTEAEPQQQVTRPSTRNHLSIRLSGHCMQIVLPSVGKLLFVPDCTACGSSHCTNLCSPNGDYASMQRYYDRRWSWVAPYNDMICS